MNTIQQRWDLFNTLAIPADIPDAQRREMKRAFYGGVIAMFQANIDIMENSVSKSEAVHFFETCSKEINDFRLKIRNGVA